MTDGNLSICSPRNILPHWLSPSSISEARHEDHQSDLGKIRCARHLIDRTDECFAYSLTPLNMVVIPGAVSLRRRTEITYIGTADLLKRKRSWTGTGTSWKWSWRPPSSCSGWRRRHVRSTFGVMLFVQNYDVTIRDFDLEQILGGNLYHFNQAFLSLVYNIITGIYGVLEQFVIKRPKLDEYPGLRGTGGEDRVRLLLLGAIRRTRVVGPGADSWPAPPSVRTKSGSRHVSS
ncbi:hypothetical protein BKA67DRAFT_540680 [Truncatella angustata]|uniref:Uncharacterized protein n=1 Tax=Truncatella angustata TaxID=152316 RepID=A0A9P8RN32_9PEZI|nr:uncharacterized protein BKA67DRAFT_540680 [Truncatella angustata]KAH6647233.1 hypothetical protein BKA67DRAFT_540680 [Truncatella angustata]